MRFCNGSSFPVPTCIREWMSSTSHLAETAKRSRTRRKRRRLRRPPILALHAFGIFRKQLGLVGTRCVSKFFFSLHALHTRPKESCQGPRPRRGRNFLPDIFRRIG